MTDEISQL